MDKHFALSFLGGAKAGAVAYEAATLESATPEFRHLMSGFCTQMVMGHEALTALTVEKGWYHAYDDPKQQLEIAIADSMKVIGTQS